MHFPGNRSAKYYFPLTEKKTRVELSGEAGEAGWYVVGLDEVLVDLEVQGCTVDFVREVGLLPGESVNLKPSAMQNLLERVRKSGLKWRYSAGGTVANTLANYTHLSGEPAVLLGAIEENIKFASPAFAFVAQSPRALSLDHLLGVEGEIGIAVTCFTPDGERSFGVAPGVSGAYPASAIPEEAVRGSSVALTTLYLLANRERPIAGAAQRLLEIGHEAGIPVAFGLGTASLVRRMRKPLIELIEAYVTIAAMNASEAEALTGETDVLLACDKILNWADVAIVTEGAMGLTLAGHTDESVKRATSEQLHSKGIREYNRWEFSRLMRKKDCPKPLRIYSHTHPFRGGPDRMSNTSGAGDAALAALLHDIAANRYHRLQVPESQKHADDIPFLSYSSLSRNAQYGNRVAYEVLKNRSPRLEGPVGSDQESGGLG